MKDRDNGDKGVFLWEYSIFYTDKKVQRSQLTRPKQLRTEIRLVLTCSTSKPKTKTHNVLFSATHSLRRHLYLNSEHR